MNAVIILRKNFCWEGARFGPQGFERTIQDAFLVPAVNDMLLPFLEHATNLPEKTRVEITVVITEAT